MTRVTGFKVLQSRLQRMQNLEEIGYRQIQRAWGLATQAFIRASLARVLVETGMSAATYFPLSRAISRLNLGIGSTVGLVNNAVAQSKYNIL